MLQVTLTSSVKKWSIHKSLHRWVMLSRTTIGIWIVLLRSNRLSQKKKKYYHLVIILLIGIGIIPLWWLTIIHHDETKLKIKLKNWDRIRVGFEVVFDLKWESFKTYYIICFLILVEIISQYMKERKPRMDK